VAMDAVAVLRRLAVDTQPGAYLILQPGPRRIVETGQADQGGRQTAVQRLLLGLQHHLAGEASGFSGRALVDPFPLVLAIDASAGEKQQALRFRATLLQPTQHIAQPLDIGLAIAGFIMLTGGCGINQIAQRPIWPTPRALAGQQITRHRQDRHWQSRRLTAQAVNRPTDPTQQQPETAAYIAAAGDHYRRTRIHQGCSINRVSPETVYAARFSCA